MRDFGAQVRLPSIAWFQPVAQELTTFRSKRWRTGLVVSELTVYFDYAQEDLRPISL